MPYLREVLPSSSKSSMFVLWLRINVFVNNQVGFKHTWTTLQTPSFPKKEAANRSARQKYLLIKLKKVTRLKKEKEEMWIRIKS